MNNDKLSNRLQKVADYVPDGARLLDVGSDHAYLPIRLLKEEKITYAIAGEVVVGPYESAKANVAANMLSNKIDIRLANGLAAFNEDDRIDTITIAGMGGVLISNILEAGKGKLANVQTLILQPNNGEKKLRIWLQDNGFEIVAETILEENDKIYEIIVARHGSSNLSDLELAFGPFLTKENSQVFKDKWVSEKKQLEKIVEDLRSRESAADKRELLEQKISEIEEITK